MTTLDHSLPYYVAYYPAEGGAAPLRLGGDGALAVWDSRDEAERYALRARAVLQIVETTVAKIEAAGLITLNPTA